MISKAGRFVHEDDNVMCSKVCSPRLLSNSLFFSKFRIFLQFCSTYSYACQALHPLIILDILNNQCIESLKTYEKKIIMKFDHILFIPFDHPCKTMKIKFGERENIVFKNQNIFLSICYKLF